MLKCTQIAKQEIGGRDAARNRNRGSSGVIRGLLNRKYSGRRSPRSLVANRGRET